MDRTDITLPKDLANDLLSVELNYELSPVRSLDALSELLESVGPSDDRVRARILMRIAQAHFDLHEVSEANRVLQQGRLLIDSQEHPYEWVMCMILLARVRYLDCNYPRARDLLQNASAILAGIPTTSFTAKTYFDLTLWEARVAIELNQLSFAAERIQRAFALAHTYEILYPPALLILELGTIYRLTYEYEVALELARWSLESVEEDCLKARALVCLAAAHLGRGEYRLCIDMYNRSLKVIQRPSALQAQITLIWGQALLEAEEPAGALEAFHQVDTILEQEYSKAIALETLILRSRLLTAQGQLREAIDLIAEVPQEANAIGSVRLEHAACTELAYLHRRSRHYRESSYFYERLQQQQYESSLARQLNEIQQEIDWSRIRRNVGSASLSQLTFQLPLGSQVRSGAGAQDASLARTIYQYIKEFEQEPAQVVKDRIHELQQFLKVLARTSEDDHTPGESRLAAREITPEELLLKLNARLTPMEAEVCTMIRSGYSSKSIAHSLGISIRTVDTHRSRIRKKLGLGSTVNLQTFLLRLN